jgi:uncharacterized membrane protein HdeD (DUF308 family)
MTTGEVRNVIDSNRRRRPLRVIAYTTLAAAGTIILTDPTQSFRGVPGQLRFFWNGMMLVGCLIAVYGAFRDRYIAEFIGMPLTLAGVLAFVVVLVAAFTSGTLAFAFFLFFIFVVLVSRGLDLWVLVRTLRRAQRGKQ